MGYYIILIILILILRSQVFSVNDQTRSLKIENRCCYVVWFLLVLMAALRSPEVGADTPGYIYDYEQLGRTTFSDLNYLHQGNYLGYFYTSKVFSLAGMPY